MTFGQTMLGKTILISLCGLLMLGGGFLIIRWVEVADAYVALSSPVDMLIQQHDKPSLHPMPPHTHIKSTAIAAEPEE